jgi:hypothetical protein
MSTTGKIVPTTHLDDKDWIAFCDYVSSNYPKSSFNHEQKEFVKKYLLQDNMKCSDMNRLWVSFFVDNLLEHLTNILKHGSVKSLNENLELLKLITVKTMIGFMNDQHSLASAIAFKDRNHEQHRMIDIHMNIMDFPLELIIDMGRLLHLERFVASSSSTSSASASGESQVLFENLHHHLQCMNEQSSKTGKFGEKKQDSISSTSVQPGTEVTTGGETTEEEEDVEWDPRVSDDTFLRLCVYKIWCDKFEQEEEWSPKKMVNEWLKEGISLYNHVSYHWPSCKRKNYNVNNETIFYAIRHTAIHSWLVDIKHRASTSSKVSKPSTNWISDWHTSPVYEKRREWETYFCHVILTAKNLSKVLPQRSDKLTVETTGTTGMDVEGAPQAKKMKTSSGGAASSPSSVTGKGVNGDGNNTGQMTALEAILDRFDALEKRIHHLENSNVHLHNEMLRELNGYFVPVKNQLYHLTFGQNFLRSRVDRMSK